MEWDSSAPGITLSGTPPSLDSLEKLNANGPAGLANLVQGRDGAPWTSFCEVWPGGGRAGRNCKRMRDVRLGPPPLGSGAITNESVDGDSFSLRYRMLYVFKDNPSDTAHHVITLHRYGDPSVSDVAFTLPVGHPPAPKPGPLGTTPRASLDYLLYIVSGGSDDVFVYWPIDPATTEFGVFRYDQKYDRKIPVPTGVDPTAPTKASGFDFLLTSDGAKLVLREPGGTMTAYSTLDESSVPLGTRPETFLLDDARHAVLTIGDDGFRSVPLDGGADTVLATTKIDTSTLRFDRFGVAYWVQGGDLWSVPLDGSRPAAVAQPGAARYLLTGPHGELVYSTDPPSRYVNHAGDGWIGGFRFMQRGRFLVSTDGSHVLGFSPDGQRLHFIEDAAQLGTVGTLTSVTLPPVFDGSVPAAPVALGDNVHSWDDLPDGRVLAIENHPYAGAWNRLVVIDEAAMSKKWVVPSATEFFLVPGGQEIIADVVSGASGYDIVRVPTPAP